MPKIPLTNDFVPQPSIQLDNPSVGALPGEALVRAGESEQQAASRLISDSRQEMDKISAAMSAHARFEIAAKKAQDNAYANNSYSTAMQEYILRANERIGKKLDDDGNPTFSKLPQDLLQLGTEISDKYGNNVGSQAATQLFNQSWAGFMSDRLPGMLEEARNQQLDFSKASLAKTMGTLQTTAIDDKFTNYPMYEKQVQNVLRNAIADGSVSATDALAMQNSFRRTVALTNINKTIFNDPDHALFQLKNGTAEDFGLTGEEYQDSIVKAQQQAIQLQKQQEIEQGRMAQEKDATAKKQESSYNAQYQVSIDKAVLDYNADRIDSLGPMAEQVMKDQNLSPVTKQTYLNKLQEASDKGIKDKLQIASIQTNVAAGKSLADYSPDMVDKAYQSMVPQGADLGTKVMVGQNFRAPLPALQKELNSSLSSGNAQEAAQAAKYVEYLNRQPSSQEVLSGMSTKTVQLASLINATIGDNLQSPEEAVRNAREWINNPDQDRVKKLEKDGDMLGASQVRDIIGTTLPFYQPGSTQNLSDKDQARITDIYKRNYVYMNGNQDAARAATINEVKALYSPTDLTKAMSVGAFRTSTTMYNAPEKVANITDSTGKTLLRYDLDDAVTEDLPAGVTVDDLIYEPVDLGGLVPAGKDPRTVVYAFKYLDDNGATHYLTNKANPDKIVAWEVSPTKMIEIEKANDIRNRGK